MVQASVMPRCSGYGIRSERRRPWRRSCSARSLTSSTPLKLLELEPLHQLDEFDGGTHQRLSQGSRTQALAGGRATSRSEPRSAVGSRVLSPGPRPAPPCPGHRCCPDSGARSGPPPRELRRKRVAEMELSTITGIGGLRERSSAARRRPCRAEPQQARCPPLLRDAANLPIVASRSAGLGLGHRLDGDRRATPIGTPPANLALRSHAVQCWDPRLSGPALFTLK